MPQLKDVTVDKISLVTKDYTPAVPKATNKYAIFKIAKPRLEKLKKFVQWEPEWKKKIRKFYAIKKLEDWDYLDISMWGYWPDGKWYTYNEYNEKWGGQKRKSTGR